MKIKFFKCKKCGKVLFLIKDFSTSAVCCGEAMTELIPGTTDGAHEKHVPVIERTQGKVKVRVGSVVHPMEEKHFIEWIALESDGRVQFKFLTPGEEPVATFYVGIDSKENSAYEYCNLHGLWASEN